MSGSPVQSGSGERAAAGRCVNAGAGLGLPRDLRRPMCPMNEADKLARLRLPSQTTSPAGRDAPWGLLENGRECECCQFTSRLPTMRLGADMFACAWWREPRRGFSGVLRRALLGVQIESMMRQGDVAPPGEENLDGSDGIGPLPPGRAGGGRVSCT